jgi:uncharacterized protein involved in exopolysaccharide biosynthesis
MTEPDLPPATPHAEPDEIDLLGLAVVVARRRRMVVLVTAGMALLGLLVALALPSTYTADAQLVRESTGDMGRLPGGLSALRSLGVSLGGESSGLSVEAFPDLLRSREVGLAVLRDTVFAPEYGGQVQVQHVLLTPTPAGRVVQGLLAPVRWLRSERPPLDRSSSPAGRPAALTEADEAALDALRDQLQVSTDLENGLMTVAASADDPYFAAALVERAVLHLTERVREIQTQKADQNLAFVEDRLREADAEMQRANARLAAFEDQNRNIQSARLRVDRDRLQQDLSFKRQVYTELRTELTRAEIERQRSEPVITFVDRPVVPAFPSGPSRALVLVGFAFFGLALSVGAALASAFVSGGDEERRAQLAELRALWPERLRRGRRGQEAGASGRETS